MPERTPLFAVADAVVLTAGLEAPHFCPKLNRTVQALLVQLAHTAPTGESYVSVSAFGFGKTERRHLFDNGADCLRGHASRN